VVLEFGRSILLHRNQWLLGLRGNFLGARGKTCGQMRVLLSSKSYLLVMVIVPSDLRAGMYFSLYEVNIRGMANLWMSELEFPKQAAEVRLLGS
jgi:hypothetical protein